MRLEKFLIEKVIGIGWFISAGFFFLAGISASYVDQILTSVLLILAVICIGVSFWYVRKDYTCPEKCP